MISEKPEEKIISKSDNIAQSESQIIEDDDDTAIFDAPQKKSISKSAESNNYLKVQEESKLQDQNVRKSVESNNVLNASQIIEDENSPTMDLSECVGDVSFFFFLLLSCLIYIKRKLHIKYIAAVYYRF